ncbi:hypothetical protein G6F41_013278 [Rhizopus arrhizus]|nr:hypothetical protein G6F41_013278 [Rhizopus arrhizus]
MTRPPSSVVETDQAFFDRVSKLWYDLATPEYCRNLIHSMPRRVRDVIQHLKPPEKQVIKKEKIESAGGVLVEAHSTGKGRRAYRKYSDEDKEYFFELVYEKGLKVAEAARKLGMPTRTAQGWYDRDQKDPQDIIQRKAAKNPVGRPPSLGEEHRNQLEEGTLPFSGKKLI